MLLAEKNLYETFTTSSFLIDGVSSSFQPDRNQRGGGTLTYVRSNIRSKILTKHNFPNDIEGLFFETNSRKSKWLLFGTYHPPSQNNQYYFDCLDNALVVYSSYEKNYSYWRL